MRALVKIDAGRFHKAAGKTGRETRSYINSLAPNAALLNSVIRQHWGIENKLRWILDVAFREDYSRKRAGNAAQNFPTINGIGLNLLKQDKSCKRGIKGKRLKAAWSSHSLLNLLVI